MASTPSLRESPRAPAAPLPVRLVRADGPGTPDRTVVRLADLGAVDGPSSVADGIAGAARGVLDELVETAETVTEDLGHAVEETVGEVLDAATRVVRGGVGGIGRAPEVLLGAARHIAHGWWVADRHAAQRVVVAGRRLVTLLAMSRRIVP